MIIHPTPLFLFPASWIYYILSNVVKPKPRAELSHGQSQMQSMQLQIAVAFYRLHGAKILPAVSYGHVNDVYVYSSI